ncbi:MAG: hypothetical protein BZ136_07190 [Methanosphaera sp. rholeuAM74]|nr:MAG: hypothetical protein BZ136_07190 [Methanosphaera sp. rholeuAM74]
MKLYNLDASALINGFYSKEYPNIMASSVVSEIKDINTEMLLNQCINDSRIIIEDVDYFNDSKLYESLVSSGDFTRLSDNDKMVVALALKHKTMGDDVITVTDDYSMQNTLKLLGLKYQPVLTKGIEKTIKWQRICKGCRRVYPSDYDDDVCEVCGSNIIRKRLNARSNI